MTLASSFFLEGSSLMPSVLTSRIDIDLIVSAFLQTGAAVEVYGDEVDPTRIGRILWSENLEAARHDLPERDWSGEETEIQRYVFHEYIGLKLGPLACVVYAYEAETGEQPGWRRSEACAILHALYRALVFQAPDTGKGPWGVRRPEDLLRVCAVPAEPRAAVKGSDFLDSLFPAAGPHP